MENSFKGKCVVHLGSSISYAFTLLDKENKENEREEKEEEEDDEDA